MKQLNKTATSSLITVLTCALAAWLVYVLALYVELVTTINSYGPNGYVEEITVPSYAKYLFLLAIAILAVGSLIARKKLLNAKSLTPSSTRLASSVDFFTATVIIISLGIAVFIALTNFLVSFSQGNVEQSIQSRIFDAYLPIILYTALIVSVLLFAFVFKKHDGIKETNNSSIATDPIEADASIVDTSTSTSSSSASLTGNQTKTQRNIALAFTVPIVAVAFALIIGLIAYDLTRTSLEVWIWVLILTLVAVGVVLGAKYAAEGVKSLKSSGLPESGAAVGANVLGLILSIIFAVAVTGMSLGYSSSAVSQLRIDPSLSLAAYSEKEQIEQTEQNIMPITALHVYGSGSGLISGSDTTLSLISLADQSELPIDTRPVTSSGYVNLDGFFPSEAVDGNYLLKISAKYPVDSIIELELPVILEGDEAIFTDGTDSYFYDSNVDVAKISGGWLVKDLLPSLVMLLLVLATLYLTIQVRNSPHNSSHLS